MQRHELVVVDLETAYAFEHIGGPTGLAELAIVDDIKPDRELLSNDVRDRLA